MQTITPNPVESVSCDVMRVSYFPSTEGRRGPPKGQIDILVPAEHGAFDAFYETSDGRQQRSSVPAPFVCVVPPNRALHIESTRPSDMVVMSVDYEYVSDHRRHQLNLEGTCESLDPFLRRIGDTLRTGFRVRRPPTEQYLKALAKAVAQHMRTTYAQHTEPARGLPSHKVERVRTFVTEGMGQSIHVDHMAAAVGLSPFHFARLFKEATGEAPHAYLTRVRIQEAKRLLADTDLPLAEIAQRVGFRTQAHFTGVFHKHAGTTPRAYRKGTRKAD